VDVTPMRLEAWAGTDVGLVRTSNEDSVGCFPEFGLFVVCDGLGGHASGEVASRLAVETVRQAVAENHPAAPAEGLLGRTRRLLGRQAERTDEDLLREAVESANRRVFDGARQGAGEDARSMATTVVALRLDLDRGCLACAHVGDSRLYRLRGGKLELLTADHTVAGSRYLGGGEIPVSLPHSNRLLQALGINGSVDVVTHGEAIAAGDVYLLCSDGLSGLVEPRVLRDTLGSDALVSDLGQKLIQLALDAGGTDNTSAVLVRLAAE
jgi:protein phosphatase